MHLLLLICISLCSAASVSFYSEPIHKQVPAFVEFMSSAKKQSYMAIASNPGLSVDQIKTRLEVWARVNDVEEQYNAFSQNFTTTQSEFDQQLRYVMQELQSLKRSIDDIVKQSSWTKIQHLEAINRLRIDNAQGVELLSYIAKQVGHDYYANDLEPKTYSRAMTPISPDIEPTSTDRSLGKVIYSS